MKVCEYSKVSPAHTLSVYQQPRYLSQGHQVNTPFRSPGSEVIRLNGMGRDIDVVKSPRAQPVVGGGPADLA